MTALPRQIKARIDWARRTRARELYLSFEGLTQIPRELASLPDLEYLDLHDNRIQNIPSWLRELPNLRWIVLTGNPLDRVAPVPGLVLDWDEHAYLWQQLDPDLIAGFRVRTGPSGLPEALTGFNKLTYLDLGDNDLEEVPRSITRFTRLNWLYLHHNRLTEIPDYLTLLENLTHLSFSENRLTGVPEHLARLTGLSVLDLSGNRLTEVSKHLTRLEQLTRLDLSNNRLESVPPSLACLENLIDLDLHGNRLTEVPDHLGLLGNLQRLGLEDNQLAGIPESLVRLGSLRRLELNGNPISTPPPEVVSRGLNAVRAYFDGLAAEGTKKLFEANLVVLGPSGVGKTALANKLADSEYQPGMEQHTRSLRLLHREVPHPDAPGRSLHIRIWDGLQAESASAVRRFLPPGRTLYMVVVGEDRAEEIETRLSELSLIIGDAPFVLVTNRLPQAVLPPPAEPPADYPNLVGSYQICLADNRGLPQMDHALIGRLARLERATLALPRSWVNVAARMTREPKPVLDWEEWLDHCDAAGLEGRDTPGMLASFLNDQGLLLQVVEDPALARILVLDPSWLFLAVSKVYEDRTLVAGGGICSESDLIRVWSDAPFRARHLDLIRLMIHFRMCFPLEQGGYLIPHHLPAAEPAYPWTELENDRLRYRFNQFPPGLLGEFTVLCHRLIDNPNHLWRGGALLRLDRARALVTAVARDRTVEIRLRGRDRDALLTLISRTMDRLAAERPGLHYEKQIQCPCKTCRLEQDPFFFDVAELRRRRRAGRGEIECGRGFTYQDVNGLLARLGESETANGDKQQTAGPVESLRDLVWIVHHENDRKPASQLAILLKPVLRRNLVVWSGERLADNRCQEDLNALLHRTKVALLLVSPDFLAEDYLMEGRLPDYLDVAVTEGLTVMWVPLRASLFEETPLSEYRAAWPPERPLISLPESERDPALNQIARTVRAALNEETAPPNQASLVYLDRAKNQ
ncbi:MAG: COR domain-containing protein [Acidobacteriota bacterium]|nr:COR domain-containing protein [Acidobacteriota bacterium]